MADGSDADSPETTESPVRPESSETPNGPDSDQTAPTPGAPAATGRSAVFWGGVVAVVVAGLVLVLGSEQIPPPLARGVPAPGFVLPVLDGERELSLSALRGRVVMVNFWATWCKPCEDEIPAMGRLYTALAGEPFELLAISVDDEVDPVREFRDRLGISFPILLDPDEEVSRRYQTTGYPETILIDAEGQVVERYVGPKDWDSAAYEGRIRALWAGAGG